MIVSGGENVFPQEVAELLQAHEAVADVAVVGVDDSEMGQRLVAFVVAKPGASVSADDIKQYVRSWLARYKVPRDVELVGEIPRTPTGKVPARRVPGQRSRARRDDGRDDTLMGHSGDDIEAYLARPLGSGPYPGVVVIHHMPGYDRATKEIVLGMFAVDGDVVVRPEPVPIVSLGAGGRSGRRRGRGQGGGRRSRCAMPRRRGRRHPLPSHPA